MKKGMLLLAMACICLGANAQNDTTMVAVSDTAGKKTVRIGNILIIKAKDNKGRKYVEVTNKDTTKRKVSRVTTNWGILDLGFSNFTDKTDYSQTGSFIQNNPAGPAIDGYDFRTRNGKSVNVNIWFFMQKVNLIKQNVNLKYGLGLELNNYRFRSPISFREDGTLPFSGGMTTNQPFVFRDTISFKKNKLAADYLTIPVMLNFATNNKKGMDFGFSAGVSIGYLYSQRNKQVSEERGKEKSRGDFDMEPFKFSYIGELTLGPVRLYGSYTPKSMFSNQMDFRPYNFGFRLSKF
ncbi:MAG: outer membrane beta-barrel protein [Ferruginibacter sp.]|nr:outer membrane beta-barrel protein [Ferruginibacter sp.]